MKKPNQYKISTLSFCLLNLLASLSFAQSSPSLSFHLGNAEPRGIFPIGIGSSASLNNHQGLILGQLLNHDFTDHSLMFLDQSENMVQFVPQNFLANSQAGLQTVLKLYPQQGGTCTGYALDDYLLQLNLAGFQGSGALKKDLSTEEGRTELLADTINQYYLVAQHQNSIVGILNGYGKRYGFKCEKQIFDTPAEAKDYVVQTVASGRPVLVSFNVGNKMDKDPFAILSVDRPDSEMQGGLWLPRKKGSRMEGGHSIVAVGSFVDDSKTFLVMLDSDWNYPRVWDLDQAITDKTAMPELEFYYCE